MIYRFLILVIILLSTSCGETLQNVENVCVTKYQDSFTNSDDNDNSQNLNFSWFAIVFDECTPVLRTNARTRTVQRTFEKRKQFTINTFNISTSSNIFKHLSQKRLLLCHLNNIGGSLLHFLCKLSL